MRLIVPIWNSSFSSSDEKSRLPQNCLTRGYITILLWSSTYFLIPPPPPPLLPQYVHVRSSSHTSSTSCFSKVHPIFYGSLLTTVLLILISQVFIPYHSHSYTMYGVSCISVEFSFCQSTSGS